MNINDNDLISHGEADEFPQYSNSSFVDDDNDSTTEIADFVDATIQDISHSDSFYNGQQKDPNSSSSNNNGGVEDSLNNDFKNENSLHDSRNDNIDDDGDGKVSYDHGGKRKKHRNKLNVSFSSTGSSKYRNDNNISTNSARSSNNNINDKSTDSCLDALFEGGDGLRITDAEADFFNIRKSELQQQLEEEKLRSKKELERLANEIRSGKDSTSPDDYKYGEEGNGVELGRVNDYIGKIKGGTDYQDLNTQDGATNVDGSTFDTNNGLSVDNGSEDYDRDRDSDAEFDDQDPDAVVEPRVEKRQSLSPSRTDRDRKLALLRQSYEAHAASESNSDVNAVYENDPQEHYTQQYLYLRSGFDYIQHCNQNQERAKDKRSPNKVKRSNSHEFSQRLRQYPTIQFIDPTSKAGSAIPTDDQTNRRVPFHRLNLFKSINHILETHHGSSIQSVRCKNLRTNNIEVIKNIPFNAQLDTPFVSDPSDWHRGPLCHVYIAACASLDHYRAKVRPFLRAFVSQVDGAGSGNKEVASSAAKQAMRKEFHQKDKAKDKSRQVKKEQVAAASLAAAKAKDAANTNASSKYMIIYVPVNPSCVEIGPTPGEEGNKGGLGGFRMRFGGRRTSDDGHSVKPGSSNEWALDDEPSVSTHDHQLNPSITRQVTKEQKEIFNKFCNDFPNAKTCLLSSLLDNENTVVPKNQIQTQEFGEILQTLGRTMVSGFTDRVQKYNNEIRKSQEENDEDSFDRPRYFLIKESLALTYEQLQLPLEALKEYEDLEDKLPMTSWPDESESSGQTNELLHAAISSEDTSAFRDILRSIDNICQLSYHTFIYLFKRQARLIFFLKDPTLLIYRFTEYIRKVNLIRCNQSEHLSNVAKAKIEMWTMACCWEMIKSSSSVLSFNLYSNMESLRSEDNENQMVCSLLDLLNFTMMRLYKLGNLLYTSSNNVRRAHNNCPKNTKKLWKPLNDLGGSKSSNIMDYQITEPDKIIVACLVIENDYWSPWTEKIVISSQEYENVFFEISSIIIRLNFAINRNRCATRILTEQAECHILRNEFDKATQKLLPTMDLTMAEEWESLLSWRLFRLMSCQRICGNVAQYLRSLTTCFSPNTASSIPPKLMDLFATDLHTIVESQEVVGHTWGLSPLLGTDIAIHPTKGGEISELSNVLQKKAFRHICHVGEEVLTKLVITSNLPSTIQVDELKITLINMKDYTLKQNSDMIEGKYESQVLDIGSQSISPGGNTFTVPWTVMTVGQYVLDTIKIQWKNALFMQDFCVPRYPALCFDVLPNEPTQSIELNPIFLIPGHVQNVRLHFNAGSDIVKGGLVELFCSQGVEVLDPGTDDNTKWRRKCSFDLKPCEPGERNTTIVTVKCNVIDGYSVDGSSHQHSRHDDLPLQTLQAIVTTSYHHELYDALLASGDLNGCKPMTAILQATVTTLQQPALTIRESSAMMYNDNAAVINAIVICNTPVPFSLKEWDVHFPSPICLDTDGDLNKGLFNRSVTEGEELHFGFKCLVSNKSEGGKSSESDDVAHLNVTLQDQYGKSFVQVLPLNIERFYEQIDDECKMSNDTVITANVSLECLEGLVGNPVKFKCEITQTNTEKECSPYLYILKCNDSEWIIGGKVRGSLVLADSENTHILEFIGIPTRSGTISIFPTLELTRLDDTCSKSKVKMITNYPSEFVSLSHKSIDTFAYLCRHEI